MTATVSPSQRFTAARPCPVCGGHSRQPAGNGTRCYGFLSDDGRYCHCTREVHAGGLELDTAGTYAHILDAPCRCGASHGTPPYRANGHATAEPRCLRTTRYPARDAVTGEVVAVHVRQDFDDGSKRMWWEQPDGTKGLGGRTVASLALDGIDQLTATDIAVLVEGEKARAALTALGIPGVGTVTGAKIIPSDDALRPLLALDSVHLWPDNDRDGESHMARIAARLVALGHPDVRRVDWTDSPPKGDAADFVAVGGTAEDVRRLIAAARPWIPRAEADSDTPAAGQRVISASDLLAKRFEPPRWAVEDMLAEGLSLLVGPPKLGKSWLVLGVAVAVASGGLALNRIKVEPGDVLYGALEDNERRLAERLRMILGEQAAPSRLHLATAWPRLGEGAEAALDAWLSDHPGARLVIVDTLARLRPLASGAGSLYGLDYAAVAGLKAVADRHRVALVAVHHTRKMTADDPLDTVSGTHGLAGAADAVLVMRREPGRADASLYLRGRDVPERDHALVFDPDGCQWALVGEVAEFRRSEERAALLQLLRDAGEALTPKQIAEALGRKDGAVRVMLHRMVGAGEVAARDGRYAPIPTPSNGNSGNGVTPPPAQSGATVTPLQVLQGIGGGNGAPPGSGVYVCAGCGLPRSLDSRPCPSCGQTEGVER